MWSSGWTTSVVSYVKPLGGMHLCPIPKLLSLRAVHLPGGLYLGAALSQGTGWGLKNGVCILRPLVWFFLQGSSGSALLALCESAHCPISFSLSPLLPLGMDTLAYVLPMVHLSAFPLSLLPAVLMRVWKDRMLVSPFWPFHHIVLRFGVSPRAASLGDLGSISQKHCYLSMVTSSIEFYW